MRKKEGRMIPILNDDNSYLSSGCQVSGSTYASCEISQHDRSTTHTDSASITMPSLPMLAVTITATELDSTSTKATEKAASVTSTPTSTGSGAKNTGSAAADAASSPSSSPTASDNAAGARVTGMSGLVVGAAAVALGMVY